MTSTRYVSLVFVAVAAVGSAHADSVKSGQRVAQAPMASVTAAACPTQALDELSLKSDFKPFLARNCPGGVRKQALRRLWRLMPPVNDGIDQGY